MSVEAALPVRLAEVRSSQIDGERALHLRGRLVLDGAAELWTDLRKATADLRRGQSVRLDVSEVEAADGGTVALLVHIRRALASRGVRSELSGADETTQALINLYQGTTRAKHPQRRHPEGVLEPIGRAATAAVDELRAMLGFLGDTVVALIGVIKAPRTGNSRDLYPTMERMGVNAVPIICLIHFLVGLVLAYMGSTQLKQFGANIFVADLVGLSVTREMGPLMTAIILSGRTGAAYAAELGAMKVGEEMDALRSMGFGPIRYLVLPRVLALVIVTPILTLIADVMGLLGGLLVGVTSLGVTAQAYVLETQRALTAWDVLSGVLKAVVFALAIAMVSCQQGFATTGGAEGVGRRTTSAVVIITLFIVVIDATFTIFFRVFGL